VGFWDTFKDFKRATRVVLVVSLLLGIAALAVGIILDETKPKWLDGLSYVPNVWAGFTGFLIGAPFALIVLSTFTVQREERAALDRVNKLSALAWDKFTDSVDDLCSRERIFTGLGTQADSAKSMHDQIFEEYQRYIALAHEYLPHESRYRGATDDEITEFQQYLRKNHLAFRQSVHSVGLTIGSGYDLQLRWSIIRTNWNTLNQYVRLQRLERNLDWFEDKLDAELVNQLSHNEHPLTEFVRLHDRMHPVWSGSMWGAVEMVKEDRYRPKDELASKLLAGYTGGGSAPVGTKYMSEFGYAKVDGYDKAAFAGQQSLRQLNYTISRIEKSGWPQSASAPTR
jgi:hypothetical protein